MTRCFADVGAGRKGCSVLNKKDCFRCKFFKTEEQAKKDREKALKRLKKLDKPTRLAIAEKYGLEGIV